MTRVIRKRRSSSRAPSGTAGPLSIARQGWFFVGGRYVKDAGGTFMAGQMYVDYQIPARCTHPYPIVMWHGNGQSGCNFTGTPDGREGWAQYFLRRGYAVYIVDQPGRGRSGYYTDVCGVQSVQHRSAVEARFTAPERSKWWPQARRHTQWPGSGVAGSAAFDQFYASQLPSIQDVSLSQSLNRDAGAALLDRIGPAILLTHSQSGTYGWLVADARPRRVKAIVAVEPSGPPVYDTALKHGARVKPWGLTWEPLRYAPAAASARQLAFDQQKQPDGADLLQCWLQKAPARRLANLSRIPVVILTGEASYHAPFDHCTARYLEQAGVPTTFIRLADRGIRGNGHMMMLERNNLEIAALIGAWLDRHVVRPGRKPKARRARRR
jgi:pimeloyl-ACP methyl ester carboxylesterase